MNCFVVLRNMHTIIQIIIYLAKIHHVIATSQDCGKQIHNSSYGVIKSPKYPEEDLEHTNCLWEIQGTPGSLISVTFHDLDIAEDDNVDCSSEETNGELCCQSNWLKIGVLEDDQPLLLCGRNKTPKPYLSNKPVVWIKYHSSPSTHKAGRGFNLSYVIFQWNVPSGCRTNETTCHPNSQECVPKCDHIMHCPNGADEVGCVKGCQERVMCDSWNSCYTPDERCNGIAQCGDHSDERNCSPELCRSERGVFLCNNKQCIRESWQCDQANDCGDNSDEFNCLKNSVITSAVMGSLICGLLLVIAVGCTCKLYALRYGDSSTGTSRSTLPLSPLEREILSREPPPPYSIAVAQTSGNYFQQVASHQAPHALDPFHFTRLCRGSHHRRSRRIRRQRRRPPTPPSCFRVVPPDVSNAVLTSDAGLPANAPESEILQHGVSGSRPISEGLVYIPPGDISVRVHGCFDKLLSPSMHNGTPAEMNTAPPNMDFSMPTHAPPNVQFPSISILNPSAPLNDYSPFVTYSDVHIDDEDDDDDDRPLLLD